MTDKGTIVDTMSEASAGAAENTRMLALQREQAPLRAELETLLAYEAWLLDGDRVEQWLELLADDLRYVAPVRRKIPGDMMDVHSIGQSPSMVAHFNDGKIDMGLRVKRMRTGYSHYDIPMALHRRLIGNVLLLDWDEQLGEATVCSNFLLFRAREEKEEALFAGQRDDVWRRIGDEWRLARRLIKLDHHIVAPVSFFF